jgi:hypothetical protein
MDLLSKVRLLVGAVTHKPFAPRPEKPDVQEADPGEPAAAGTARRSRSSLEQQSQVKDTERVADLIARQKQDEK